MTHKFYTLAMLALAALTLTMASCSKNEKESFTEEEEVLNEDRILTDVVVAPSEVDIYGNGSAEIHVYAFYDDGSKKDITKSKYLQYDNGSVANFDPETGKIYCHNIHGTTFIYFKYTENGIMRQDRITVYSIDFIE